MAVNVKCCVDCICVAVCKQKAGTDLVHNCSIIRDELRRLTLTTSCLVVRIDPLDKEVTIEGHEHEGEDFIFFRFLPTDPFFILHSYP